MKSVKSLSILLPLGLIAIAMLMISVSIINGLVQREVSLTEKSIEDIRLNISRLTGITERLSNINLQLIEDDLSQSTTDPRVATAAVINHIGNIQFASKFSLRNKPALGNITGFDEASFNSALQIKSSIITRSTDNNHIFAYMSYSEPAQSHMLRSQKKGIVYLEYDITYLREQLFNEVLSEHAVESIILLISVIIIAFLLNRFVITPLSSLQHAAIEFSRNNFSTRLEPVGPIEITSLTQAFNKMSAELSENITKITDQQKNTQTILDNVIDGIITIDKNGTILSFNNSAETIFGYTSIEAIGRNVNILMPEPYHSAHDSYLTNYIDSGVAKVIGIGREVQGKRKNNDVFPMDLAVSEIKTNNEPVFIGIVRDITERKKMEKIKSEFISTISHELRTPLTAINGSVSLIKSGLMGKLNPQGNELLQSAIRNGERLLHLINDLLDMEKIMAGRMQYKIVSVKLEPLLEDALSMNTVYAEQFRVTLEKDFGTTNTYVNIDENRLMQVITNLLSNACKHSRKEDRVILRTEAIGDSVRISVIDFGEGIDEEFKTRIFEKFSQADSSDTRRHSGTGLGLAISRELIESMGGKIYFESRPGQGSTFFVEFPIALA